VYTVWRTTLNGVQKYTHLLSILYWDSHFNGQIHNNIIWCFRNNCFDNRNILIYNRCRNIDVDMCIMICSDVQTKHCLSTQYAVMHFPWISLSLLMLLWRPVTAQLDPKLIFDSTFDVLIEKCHVLISVCVPLSFSRFGSTCLTCLPHLLFAIHRHIQ